MAITADPMEHPIAATITASSSDILVVASSDSGFVTRATVDSSDVESLIIEVTKVTVHYAGTDNEEVDEEDADSDAEIVAPTPQILMLSSGEITPFDLYFEMEKIEPAYQLSVLPDGTRELTELEYGY